MSSETAEVVELSRLLNMLPIHPTETQAKDFRNPTGVHMKLRNLCGLDPPFRGKGLGRGGALERIVWRDFVNDRESLQKIARAIRLSYRGQSSSDNVYDEALDESQFREGRFLVRVHNLRERNLTLIRRKKSHVLKSQGKLTCEVAASTLQNFMVNLVTVTLSVTTSWRSQR